MEIYWGSGSQPSWRVLLTLEFKGIAYDSELISFQKGEHKTPEFLKMNPRHKVPTLKDGTVIMYESIAIMAYIEAAYPDPPIFGTTIQETGEIWRRVMEFLNYVDVPLHTIVRSVFFGKTEENRHKINESIPVVQKELALLDAALKDRVYFVGGTITAADLAIYPNLMGLVRASGKPGFDELSTGLTPLRERFPHLGAWMGRIELLPGYDRTYPPHWREG
jgi:glutathione S-transferase